MILFEFQIVPNAALWSCFLYSASVCGVTKIVKQKVDGVICEDSVGETSLAQK